MPILAFPDMGPDEQIDKLARRKRVCLIWRTDNPDIRLQEILRAQPVRETLSAERIAREVHAVTDGLIHLGRMSDATAAGVSCTKSPDNYPEPDPAATAPKRLLINLGKVGLIEARARVIQIHTNVRS